MEGTAQRWLCRSRFRNFDVKDISCSNRAIMGKVNQIMADVDKEQHESGHDIARKVDMPHQTVLLAGWLQKETLDVWMPHESLQKHSYNYRVHTIITCKRKRQIYVLRTFWKSPDRCTKERVCWV